jgi:hypothetical protein
MMVKVCLFSKKLSNCLPKWLCHSAFLLIMKVPIAPDLLQHLFGSFGHLASHCFLFIYLSVGFFCLFNLAVLGIITKDFKHTRQALSLSCIFSLCCCSSLYFPNKRDVETSHILTFHLCIFYDEAFVWISHLFFNPVFCGVLNNSSLSHVPFASTPSVQGLSSHSLDTVFHRANFFKILIKSNLLVLSCIMFSVVCFKSLPYSRLFRHSPILFSRSFVVFAFYI